MGFADMPETTIGTRHDASRMHEFTRNLCQPSLVGPPQPNLSTMSARHPSVHKRLPASFICIPKPCSVRPEKAHFPPTRLGGIGSVGTFISPNWTRSEEHTSELQ